MIKRYKLDLKHDMVEDKNGEWVKWEDVKKEAEMGQSAEVGQWEKARVEESPAIKALREQIEDMREHYRKGGKAIIRRS